MPLWLYPHDPYQDCAVCGEPLAERPYVLHGPGHLEHHECTEWPDSNEDDDA